MRITQKDKFNLDTILLEIAVKENRPVEQLYWFESKKVAGKIYFLDKEVKKEGKPKVWFIYNV